MPPARKHSIWLVVLVGAAILGSCGVLGGGLLLAGAVAFSSTEERDIPPARVENIARLRLPKSYGQLRSHLDGFQDRIIHVRFHMHERDLADFDSSLSCRLSAISGPLPPQSAYLKSESWWDLNTVTKGRSCETSNGSFHQSVIVDDSHAPELIVYVLAFET